MFAHVLRTSQPLTGCRRYRRKVAGLPKFYFAKVGGTSRQQKSWNGSGKGWREGVAKDNRELTRQCSRQFRTLPRGNLLFLFSLRPLSLRCRSSSSLRMLPFAKSEQYARPVDFAAAISVICSLKKKKTAKRLLGRVPRFFIVICASEGIPVLRLCCL